MHERVKKNIKEKKKNNNKNYNSGEEKKKKVETPTNGKGDILMWEK